MTVKVYTLTVMFAIRVAMAWRNLCSFVVVENYGKFYRDLQ